MCQNSVLEPPLLNVYYADVALSINLTGFLKIIFAYYLNYFKHFGINVANEPLKAKIYKYHHVLQNYSTANQITVDLAN